MKKTILICMAVLTFFSCNASEKKDKAAAETENTKTEVEVNAKATTIHLTKAEFLKRVANYETNPKEWKYLGDKPCIIDFYADWCGPCRKIAPILDELAAEYGGQIYIYKIDVDKEKELASVFGISSIPALFFIPLEGAPQVARGVMPKSDFERAINEILLPKSSAQQ